MPSSPGDFYIMPFPVVLFRYLDSRMVLAKQLRYFKSFGNAPSQFFGMKTLLVSILQDSTLHAAFSTLLN